MVGVGNWIVTALLLRGWFRLLDCYIIVTANVTDCICAYTINHKWHQIIPDLKSLTLSDPMSDLVRHYDFPVSDAFLDL
jgi:hypothetical protein